MPFFFTLRQSSNNTIEPSLLPTSSGPKFSTNWSTSPFYEYITTWDFTDRPGTFRRLACILAFVLHIPLNIISILSWGFLFIFLGILLSLLNLACVGAALWKLDVMSGERQFYGRSLKRRHFDFAIFALVAIYGVGFVILLMARLHSGFWMGLFRAVWPCLIVTDIFCFIAGWVATWRGINL
ncbi:hypothetical protein L207DRAFT_198612 [Hyaloscypha variabilis F]|uniref:Uncharacterized protein n=1 Tax=Hyaloscypha variabilis (strain UAMH 11265 / GT02V1 / F) TaxID=1149755 RepID=A0A2J6QWR5_HYAVF|nr:hypothetical protein L207DRAFT_198612 [Hyaloscypha variabilis F]